MNDSKFTLLPTQVTKTIAAFLNERLNERQKAELRALLGSGEGGAMTGEDIAAALDTFLEGSEWRGGDTAMTGEAIQNALDSLLGSSWRDAPTLQQIYDPLDNEHGMSWRLILAQRPYSVNVKQPFNIGLGTETGTNVHPNFFFFETSYDDGYVPDGITNVYFTDTAIADQAGADFWPIPTSTVVVAYTDSTATSYESFQNLIKNLYKNSKWNVFPNARTLDATLSPSVYDTITLTGFYANDTQNAIDVLIDNQNWTILTPNNNVPDFPWFSLPEAGIPSKVPTSVDNLLGTYIAVGDGGVTLPGGNIWICESASDDPADWVELSDFTIPQWPKRAVVSLTYNHYFTNSSQTFVHTATY